MRSSVLYSWWENTKNQLSSNREGIDYEDINPCNELVNNSSFNLEKINDTFDEGNEYNTCCKCNFGYSILEDGTCNINPDLTTEIDENGILQCQDNYKLGYDIDSTNYNSEYNNEAFNIDDITTYPGDVKCVAVNDECNGNHAFYRTRY